MAHQPPGTHKALSTYRKLISQLIRENLLEDGVLNTRSFGRKLKSAELRHALGPDSRLFLSSKENERKILVATNRALECLEKLDELCFA